MVALNHAYAFTSYCKIISRKNVSFFYFLLLNFIKKLPDWTIVHKKMIMQLNKVPFYMILILQKKYIIVKQCI